MGKESCFRTQRSFKWLITVSINGRFNAVYTLLYPVFFFALLISKIISGFV